MKTTTTSILGTPIQTIKRTWVELGHSQRRLCEIQTGVTTRRPGRRR